MSWEQPIRMTCHGHVYEGSDTRSPLGNLLHGMPPSVDGRELRFPILPRAAATDLDNHADTPIHVRTLTLTSVRIMHVASRQQEQAWSCPPDGVADLHRIAPVVFQPTRPISPRTHQRWYQLQAEMAEASFNIGVLGEEARRQAGERLLHELEDDVIERARASAYLSAGPRAVTSEATTGRLTAEGLQNMMRQMDYANVELRMAAQYVGYRGANPLHSSLGERLANDISRGVDPEREPRRTSQLRPIEDFLDGAEELIEAHRKRWLGDVKSLPDARKGPAPVPASCPEEHCYDHDEDRPAPLAPPAAFLPGGRR